MKPGLAAAFLSAICCVHAFAATVADPGYRMVGTVALPDGAFGTAVIDLQTRQMLIAQQGGISAFDLDLQTVRGGLVSGGALVSVAALGASGQDAATDRAGSIITFDGHSGKVTKTLKLGGGLLGSYFDPKTALLAVSSASGIALIDPQKHAVAGTVALEAKPSAVITGNGNGLVYTGTSDGKEITVLDPAARTVTQHLPVTGCGTITGLAYSDDTETLILACDGVAKFISATSGSEVGSVGIGKTPGQVLFDHDRHIAMVPGSADGSLAVMALDDRGGGKLVQTVRVPNGIRSGVIDQVTGRVFLLVPGSGPGGNRILVVDPA